MYMPVQIQLKPVKMVEIVPESDVPGGGAAGAVGQGAIHQRRLGVCAITAHARTRVGLLYHRPVTGVAAEAGVDAGRQRWPRAAALVARERGT